MIIQFDTATNEAILIEGDTNISEEIQKVGIRGMTFTQSFDQVMSLDVEFVLTP